MLGARLKRFPSADDIEKESDRIRDLFPEHDLLRIYFYDAPPAKDSLQNPIDGSRLELSKTKRFREYQSLLSTLEMKPNYALRLGDTFTHGWEVGKAALADLQKGQRPLQPRDLVPSITQKGVDLRIGLDIARLALREMVRAIVVVTGDSDMVPAFKFARREGVHVYLDHLGHGVRRELKAHADIVL